MARAAAWLPFGHIAFRINLLSAACAALTVLLLFRLVLRLAERDGPAARAGAAVAALALGGGTTLWLHATTTEVYVPNLLGLVWLMDLLLSASRGSQRALRAAAVLTGLGAGLHAATFAIVAAVLWLTVGLRAHRSLRGLVSSLALGITSLLVIAYLPIRAAAGPWRNWGRPDSLDALWAHLSGARIRDAYQSEMSASGRLWANLEVAGHQLASQVSWFGVVAAVGLIALLVRRRFGWALALAGVWAADLAYTVVLNPMGMVDFQTGTIVTLATAILAGVGLVFVAELGASSASVLARPPARALLVFLGGFGLASPAVFGGGPIRDLRMAYHPQDLADLTFDTAWPRAILLVSSDDLASTTTYAQGVENQRPDVLVLVKQHITDVAGLEHLATHQPVPELLLDGARAGTAPRALLGALVAALGAKRPIQWELGDALLDGVVADRLRVGLPAGRLYGPVNKNPGGTLTALRDRWRALSSRWPASTRAALARMYSLLGTHLLSTGRVEAGRQAIITAHATYHDDVAVLTNYARVRHQLGDTEEAQRVYERIVALRPDYALGWYNLGVDAFRRGDAAQAHSAFETAARLGLNTRRAARAGYYAAILRANAGEHARAMGLLLGALDGLPPAERRDAERMLNTLLTLSAKTPER